MDMGQCNDAYGAIQVAVALADAFGCSVNELPLSFVLSWYEQKAVCILLTLLHLGIKNIRLGPSLPAFLSPNILNYLLENYGIAPITTPDEDTIIKVILNTYKFVKEYIDPNAPGGKEHVGYIIDRVGFQNIKNGHWMFCK